jgi:PAS domain S-box-containing protein
VLGGAVVPSPEERRLARSLPLEVGSVRFILTAWPTPSTLANTRSSLPGLVMALGLVLAALMTGIISLAQHARRSAREAERGRLALAVERATDGIWEWDLVTGSSVRSRGMLRYLGYEAQAMPDVPQTWMGLIHPADRPDVEAALARHLAGEAPTFEAVYRVRNAKGRWHVIVDRGRVTDRDPDGRPLRVLGISADVTEAREAQAAQEATERRFRTLFDSGFQPKLLLDSAGQVIEVNRAALDAVTLGDGVEIRGRPVWEVLWWALDPAAVPRLKQAIGEAGSDGGVARYEETLQGPGGQVVILEIGIKPIEQGPGQAPQLLLEARDLTARRRAEAALQEVDTLTTMGRVAARVAHEINNPLAGIQNSFLLIKGAIPADHPHFRYVGAIEREIGRIAAVTRQLYETYRPETDRTGETSVRTVLGDAVAFMEQVNRSSRVTVELRFEQLPTVVPLPSSMLRQIAYNLVQNAIEASPPDCTVTITAGVEGGSLYLRVSDCGPGIPAELRDRIFEPFFSTKDKRIRTGGMGLGLALVRRTVTAAGGTIAVQDADGGGSIFMVTLPLVHDQDRGVAS